MKHLKILPLAVITTLFAQDTFAIGEGAVRKADEIVNQQQQQNQQNQLLQAQNLYLGGLGLPTDNAYRAALLAVGGHGAAPAAQIIVLRKIQTAGEAVDHTDPAQQAAVADLLPLVLPGRLNLIDDDTVPAAVALRAAGPAIPVTENNVRAAVALAAAAGGVLPVNAGNVAAAVLLAPYVAGGGGRQVTAPQIAAVVAATAVNPNVRDAMVWAITNGFGGQAVGTVPAGIAEVTVSANVSTLAVRYGAVPFGATPGRFAGQDMQVHQNHLGGGAPALNSLIVFTGAIDDPINGANITVQNYAVAP